jgi:hypothetical protein
MFIQTFSAMNDSSSSILLQNIRILLDIISVQWNGGTLLSVETSEGFSVAEVEALENEKVEIRLKAILWQLNPMTSPFATCRGRPRFCYSNEAKISWRGCSWTLASSQISR